MQEKPSDLLKFAIQLAKEGAKIMRTCKSPKIVTYKEAGDFALDVDVRSEKHILRRIKQKYPKHSIITEETRGHEKKSDYTWIIDPLEGTLNYKHCLPFYAVNIGLFYKGKPFIGVVNSPILNEMFYALKGKGAYLNGKRIHVNKDKEIIRSFFTGNVKHFCELNISRHLLRSLGCTGLEMSYVASGRFGARIKVSGQDPYGYGAGSIIVLEAGGKLTDMKGKPWNLKSNGALASNGLLHNKLLKLFSNIS